MKPMTGHFSIILFVAIYLRGPSWSYKQLEVAAEYIARTLQLNLVGWFQLSYEDLLPWWQQLPGYSKRDRRIFPVAPDWPAERQHIALGDIDASALVHIEGIEIPVLSDQIACTFLCT